MAQVKVFYDQARSSLTVWFSTPYGTAVHQRLGEDVVLIKDTYGGVVGVQKLNFRVVGQKQVNVTYEMATAMANHQATAAPRAGAANTWTNALAAYEYGFDLRDFADAHLYPGWFLRHSERGNRDDTVEFEKHFRQHAPKHIEPWLEVVFWKMYVLGMARDQRTRDVAANLVGNHITAQRLWESCTRYVGTPSDANFEAFRRLLFPGGHAIAVASVFPAFMSPDRYPVIDNARVARWIDHYMDDHNRVDPLGPQLVRRVHQGNLNMGDFDFMQAWIRWCRHTAGKISDRTGVLWRARDVEMAVFRAWGGLHDPHPLMNLELLAP